jgi:hypothetical protein
MSATFVTKRAHERELEEVDAKKPLAVEVTARDIKLAKAKNSKECALARAVKRSMPVKAAYFLRTTAWLEFEDKMVRYRLPPSVQKEIVSFDRNKMMSTGEYVLSPVSPQDVRKPRVNVRAKSSGKKVIERSKRALKGHAHRLDDVRTKFEPKDEE